MWDPRCASNSTTANCSTPIQSVRSFHTPETPLTCAWPPALFYGFLRLRDAWPEKGVEIKGSKLDEIQTAEVMNLLAAHEAIAEYHAIDMTLHPNDVIDEFKEHQAAALTANLTPAHAQSVARRLKEDGDAIRSLSTPLFVQAFLTIELILELLDVSINYFAQRRPEELGRFAWTIDRKDRTVTQMEQLWSTLILPFGVPRSALRPYAKLEGFDYSHFAKYEIDEDTADEKMRRHLQWMRENLPPSNLFRPNCAAWSAVLCLSAIEDGGIAEDVAQFFLVQIRESGVPWPYALGYKAAFLKYPP